MNIFGKLLVVQAALKVPKGQYNSFGKYNYRSCEDILEAVKPHLIKAGLLLTLTDDIKAVGERFYVEATATLIDTEDGEKYAVRASAREDADKKGMDGSQITGAASSYARKYALNGLFSIDDTKDADATNDHGKGEAKPPKQADPPKQEMGFKCERCGKGILSYKGKDGKPVPIRKHCEGSKAKFGQVLCLDCIEVINIGG